MRYPTTAIILLGLVLAASPMAWASAANEDALIHDPEGDAGPAGAPLGPAAANLDILAVDFATEDDQTTATMELAAFDVRPHETFYGMAYELNGSSFVWFGYGKMIFPFPPFEVEGFYGCHITEDGETCQELEGTVNDEVTGFTVNVPRSWAPATATLEHPMAATFHDPFLPGEAGALWWQAVWPHNTEDMAHTDESYHVPGNASEERPADAEGQDALTSTSPDEDAPQLAGVGTGTLGALVASGLGVLGLAGVAIRRVR